MTAERSILFITKGENDSATRYRAKFLFPLLGTENWRITHVPCNQPWYRLRLLLAARRSRIVLIQRKLLYGLTFIVLKVFAHRIVFDFDDAIFLKSNGKPSATRGRRFAAIIRSSSLVLAGNNYLAEQARECTGHTLVTPTSLQMAKYPAYVKTNKSGPELVWIGSRSTSKYLFDFRDSFEAIHKVFPELRFKIIADFKWPDCPVPSTPVTWSEECEFTELQAALIGIAPMPDNPWTRGKCALKVIQYMAAGLPVISSCTGANREVIEHGVTGFLCNTTEEWCAAIKMLLADSALRERMGKAGRQRVEKHYSQEVIATRILKELERLSCGIKSSGK